MPRITHPATATAATAAALALAAALAPAAVRAAPADACALLTPAQVAAVIGGPVSAGEPIMPGDHKVCTWRGPPGGGFVTLMLQTAQQFDRARQQAGDLRGAVAVTPVAGLGDGAMYVGMGDNVGLVVKKGAAAFKVAVYQHTSLDRKQAAEKTLAANVLAGF
jgi:hypothetical protein